MEGFEGRLFYGSERLVTAAFREQIVKDGLTRLRHLSWVVEESMIVSFDDALVISESADRTSWLEQVGEALVRVGNDGTWGYRELKISLAATSPPAIDEAEVILRQRYPEYVPPPRDDDPGEVDVTFWFSKNGEATRRTRTITAPAWSEIRDNYPASTATSVDHLTREFRPTMSGKLFVWQGPPGTGKTYAIRSLAREWRHWCSFNFIIDPERLFTLEPAYLVDFLTAQDPGMTAPAGCTCHYCSHPEQRWTMLILEDAGNLLHAHADSHAGQGLSRLLNLVDGILGQGLRVMVLITTNDEIARMHPAVSRPGRCADLSEFQAMPIDDAKNWLTGRGGPPDVGSEQTLAQLYAKVTAAKLSVPQCIRDHGTRRACDTGRTRLDTCT